MNMTSEFRKDPLNTAVSSGHLKEDTVTPPMQANGDCDGETVLRVKRSLRRRNGVDYCVFEYSSDEELDNEKLVKTHQSKHSQQTNNTGGSSVASKCDEVTGRWCPKQACRPIIDEAPVFYPTEEEFSDALGYIASIRYKAEKYGICRIVPPSSWNPSCPLKEKSIWDLAKFSTRAQQIDKLQNREPTKKKSRNRFQRKRKRRKGLRFGMTRRRTNCSNIETDDCFSDTEEKFGFQSGSDFTLQSFQVYSENFKEQYFGMGVARNSDTDKRWQPSVEEIEGEYWRIVENPSDEVEVFYGADLETGIFGSGFPKANSKTAQGLDPHVNSGWNLNNFPRLPGSVLSFESGDISGVVVSWLYIGMCFSSFCWHVEDHHLYSLNYLHWGDPKIWYGVPSNAAVKLEDAMKKYLPELFEEQPDLLHELVTQLSPSVLKSEGIPVYRAIQKVGEFILTFPRAYHSGFNCGFNCAEAVNVAPMDWLAHGQCAVELYREQRRKTSISHDKLLMGAAQGAVRALWDLLLLGMDKPCNVKWQSVCGKEGILTEAIRARVEMEELRRTSCCTSTSVRKMDDTFDLSKERECFYCFYDLYLSAAGCECSLDRYACLNHADILCSCEPSQRFFLFRYTMNQLNTLVQALNECLNAVLHWGSYELGLVPPSKPIDKYVSNLVLQKSLTVSNKELIDVDLSCSAQMEAIEDINELCMSENNFVLDVNASLKTDLESGGSNKVSSSIDMDLIDLQRICTSKKNGIFSADSIWVEEPRWCLDLNNEDLTLDCKANIEGWPSDETMNNIKKEQNSSGTSNTLLGSSPEGGSSGSIAMSNKMSDPSCIAKLFGINLHQHQPVFHVNSNFEGKQPFNNCLPNSGGPISPNPESEKYIIASPYFVEPLHVGTAMFGKKWCNKKAIFPKGFRSRVRYFSLIDPTKTCFYISEILDGGLFGPLFQVTMEDSPEDTFTHSSPQQSWDLVRERLNQEIIKQCSSRNQGLPTLQPPGSIDGFQMFGFFSPLICQVIESLDPDHRCVEYWAFKPTSPPKDEPAKTAVNHPPQQNALSVRQGRIFGVDITEIDRIDSISDDEVEHVLGPLFHRLRREELEMMRKILVSGRESDCWRAAYRALLNEIEKNVDKNDLTNLAPRDFFSSEPSFFP